MTFCLDLEIELHFFLSRFFFFLVGGSLLSVIAVYFIISIISISLPSKHLARVRSVIQNPYMHYLASALDSPILFLHAKPIR